MGSLTTPLRVSPPPDTTMSIKTIVRLWLAARTFMECAVCGTPLVITDKGLVYCPKCDPQDED